MNVCTETSICFLRGRSSFRLNKKEHFRIDVIELLYDNVYKYFRTSSMFAEKLYAEMRPNYIKPFFESTQQLKHCFQHKHNSNKQSPPFERYKSSKMAEATQVKVSAAGSVLRSSHESGMNSSIFRFKNINCVVKSKGEDKVILDNVSGTVKWGHVLAIMGPSGAGKVGSRIHFRDHLLIY